MLGSQLLIDEEVCVDDKDEAPLEAVFPTKEAVRADELDEDQATWLAGLLSELGEGTFTELNMEVLEAEIRP